MKVYSFCNRIRLTRISKKLPLRKVAAFLDIDQSTLSKIERGERVAPRELLLPLSEILELEFKELLTNYLADKIVYSIKEEDDLKQILSFAEQKINYKKI